MYVYTNTIVSFLFRKYWHVIKLSIFVIEQMLLTWLCCCSVQIEYDTSSIIYFLDPVFPKLWNSKTHLFHRNPLKCGPKGTNNFFFSKKGTTFYPLSNNFYYSFLMQVDPYLFDLVCHMDLEFKYFFNFLWYWYVRNGLKDKTSLD